jgi:hypothetical protein
MESKGNKLAIIVAFYLSKYGKAATIELGYKTDSQAFTEIGTILDVKKNYIKFRRDEFDPIHPWKKGWVRPMDKRIVSAIEALQDLEESALRDIVKKILSDNDFRNGEDVQKITNLFKEEKQKKTTEGKYILRGPTGRLAENYFLKHFEENNLPIRGEIIDSRDLGCGFDFEIKAKGKSVFVEVKGLAKVAGGILFTNKEWETAKKHRENYYLAIVKGFDTSPEILFLQNPAEKLKAKMSLYTTVQTSWSVTEKQLAEING